MNESIVGSYKQEHDQGTLVQGEGSPVTVMSQASGLPWPAGSVPLMLAPMQGLTNRALRAYFIEQIRPDVVFTEFMRVNAAAEAKRLSPADLRDIAAAQEGVPLVVQLVGYGREPLVSAAREVQAAGAAHINLNMGCPFGRMTTGLTGGGMLRRPEELAEIIHPLRDTVRGTFSVKLRAGYDDGEVVFHLLPLFEAAGVDFLILHPRTVIQKYAGAADHAVTARVVRATRLPVVANGDIRTAADGERVLRETGAVGLMLGRGAIADPLLFNRLRGKAPAVPGLAERRTEMRNYLQAMLVRYGRLFCGPMQVLAKLKEIIAHMDDPDLAKPLKELQRAKTVGAFEAKLAEL